MSVPEIAVPAIKICGVCSAADARHATSAGASYIGVILAPGRSRTRTRGEAAVIFQATAAQRVGVFVDATATEVLGAADRLRLDVVQLHGDEAPEMVQAIVRGTAAEVWKVCRVREASDVTTVVRDYTAAGGLLLDGWSPHAHGGVGAAFDWSAVARLRELLPAAQRLIVAGGLRPDNVGAAISQLRPDVVDVSSGVETSPGSKSAQLINEFIAAARGARNGR